VEARQAIAAMISLDGPVYIQMTREPSPVLFDAGYRFEVGASVRVREGADVTLVSTGVQTARVYEAAEILGGRGIEATVLHVPTIKPIDEEASSRPPGQWLCRGGGRPDHPGRAGRGGERGALGALPGLRQKAGGAGRLRGKRAQRPPAGKVPPVAATVAQDVESLLALRA